MLGNVVVNIDSCRSSQANSNTTDSRKIPRKTEEGPQSLFQRAWGGGSSTGKTDALLCAQRLPDAEACKAERNESHWKMWSKMASQRDKNCCCDKEWAIKSIHTVALFFEWVSKAKQRSVTRLALRKLGYVASSEHQHGPPKHPWPNQASNTQTSTVWRPHLWQAIPPKLILHSGLRPLSQRTTASRSIISH